MSQIYILKPIMHLPDRSADAAIYVLCGHIATECEIHKCTLSTIGSILWGDSVEHELSERPILVKDLTARRWIEPET